MTRVILPANEQELVECLVDSSERRQTLELIGGGSRRGVGDRLDTNAVLDVSRISGIIDYDPTELVLTARAGTRMTEINALLSDRQQMLAFEPPSMGTLTGNVGAASTLGGSVASNSAGPRRIAAGAARDHFLGFRAVSGRGEPFKSGGRVVKNVTGFDLSRLLAGSWGSLAVLTELSVRVMPKPRYGTTLMVAGLDIAPACAAMSCSQALPCSVSAAAYLPPPVAERLSLDSKESLMLVRLEGFRESVDARVRTVTRALERFGNVARLPEHLHVMTWSAIAEVASLLPPDGSVWRISVPAGETVPVCDALTSAQWLVDWGGGLVWYCDPAPPRGRTLARVQCWRGRTSARPASRLPTAHAVLDEALKAKFDPFRILNPRRPQADANAIH